MKYVLISVLGLVLMMTACGEPSNASMGKSKLPVLSAQSITAASSGNIQTFMATVTGSSVIQAPGIPTQTDSVPDGLTIAVRFSNFSTRTRVDIPSSMFPDGRSRIAVYDTGSQQARVVFADNLTADPAADNSEIAGMITRQVQMAQNLTTGSQPYHTMTGSQFSSKMQAQGSTVQPTTTTDGPALQASSSQSLPNNTTQTMVITYNSNSSTVSRINTVLENNEARQTSDTAVQYTAVSNMADTYIPTRFVVNQTITAKYTGQPIQVSQDTNYQNVQINTLPDSYFNIGGL